MTLTMNDFKQLNFVIAGAPKCGTSAIVSKLREHPKIHISTPKETFFFNPEMPARRSHNTYAEYQSVFKDIKAGQLAGDGSIWSMYSPSFPQNALEINPDIKVVVLLRNPADLVRSLYYFNLEKGYEDAPNLASAWERQDVRARGIGIPRGCPEPNFLQYRNVVRFEHHLSKLRHNLAQKQLFIADPFEEGFSNTANRIIHFLGLSGDVADVPFVNVTSYSTSNLQLALMRTARTLRQWVMKRGVKLPSTGLIHNLKSNSRAKNPQTVQTPAWLKQALSAECAEYERVFDRGG